MKSPIIELLCERYDSGTWTHGTSTQLTEEEKLFFRSANKTPKNFIDALKKQGVIVEPVRNKQNKIYGIRFKYEGQTFKASEIGKEFGFRSLFHHYGQSIDERPIHPKYFEKPHFDNTQTGSGLLSGLTSIITPEASSEEYDDALPVWKAEEMRKKKRKKLNL